VGFSSDFFRWLADQPPCVEVFVGMLFCLVVAPAVLAGVAMAVTALESAVEARIRAYIAEPQVRAMPAHLQQIPSRP
jgi:hypothetical protein